MRVSGQANSIELEKALCQAQSPDRQTKNKVNISYTEYPIIRNGDQAPLVGFLKNSPI